MKKTKLCCIGSLALLSATLPLLWGCSDEYFTGKDEGQLINGNHISFRALGSRTDTRVTTATSDNITAFTVSGLYLNGTTPVNYFDAVTVQRTEGNTGWDYSPKQGWRDYEKIRFYAYSPAGSPNVRAGFKGNTNHTLKYTVPTDFRNQEDLLVAVTDSLNSASNNGVVSFNFKHALSRVVFRAKSGIPGTMVYVDDVTLMNLYKTGEMVMDVDNPTIGGAIQGTPADADGVSVGIPTGTGGFNYWKKMPDGLIGATDAAQYLVYTPSTFEYFWKVGLASDDRTNDFKAPISQAVAAGSEFRYITSDADGLMIMPQLTDNQNGDAPDIDADFCVKVSYRISEGGSTKTKLIAVKDWWKRQSGNFVFEPGKQYSFDFIVGEVGSRDAVTMDVGAVDDFDVAPSPYVPKLLKTGDKYTINGEEYTALAAEDHATRTVMATRQEYGSLTWRTVSAGDDATIEFTASTVYVGNKGHLYKLTTAQPMEMKFRSYNNSGPGQVYFGEFPKGSSSVTFYNLNSSDYRNSNGWKDPVSPWIKIDPAPFHAYLPDTKPNHWTENCAVGYISETTVFGKLHTLTGVFERFGELATTDLPATSWTAATQWKYVEVTTDWSKVISDVIFNMTYSSFDTTNLQGSNIYLQTDYKSDDKVVGFFPNVARNVTAAIAMPREYFPATGTSTVCIYGVSAPIITIATLSPGLQDMPLNELRRYQEGIDIGAISSTSWLYVYNPVQDYYGYISSVDTDAGIAKVMGGSTYNMIGNGSGPSPIFSISYAKAE